MHEQIGLSPVNEMLYIKQLRPRLNVQTDSLPAKVFGRVFTIAVVSLSIPENGLFTDFVQRLKMIHVFTGKIQ